MKNTQKKGLAAVLALAVLPVVFLTNCKVGLGSAVDTKAPSVAITYPSTDSVIRDTFIMSGTADDETGVSSVNVVLTKLPAALGIKTDPITGVIDSTGKKWTASINAKDPVTGAYAVADGKYEALVTVTDTVGRKSSTTVIYTIDNTRPIVAVSQPATRGAQNPWEFGSELNFTGLQYDENISGVFTINFFDAAGTNIGSYRGTNVLTDWALDVKEDNAAFQALVKAMTDINIPQKFWYSIAVEDLAYEYKDPSEAADTAKTGNASTYYYSWTDISSLLVAGDFAPKINALYNMDSGLSVSSSEMPSSITLNKLKEIRIALGLPADQVTSQYGAFTIDPSNRQPVISTDGILPGDNRSNENQIGKGETIRFEIKKNKDNTPILVNEMKYRLDSYVENTWREGTTTPIALSEITQGTTIVYNYSAPVEVGTYRLVFDVKDLNKSNARNATYEFIVNAGAPTFTIAPGSSIYAPGETFTAKITALDDSRALTLKVLQRTAGGLTAVTAYPDTITTTAVSGSESNYTSVWTLTLPAAENGSDVTYRFEVSDGKWSNSKEQTFTTDNNSPVLRELNSPSMNVTAGSGTEICHVSAPALTVLGKADADIRQARVRVTTDNTPPDGDITNEEWKVVNVAADVSADGFGKFTAAIELPSNADGVIEGNYYAWYCFADDTYDEVTKQMGPVTKLFDIVADKNDPNISFTINGNPETDYVDTIDGYNIVPADFTISGHTWDAAAGSSEGITSLTYTQYLYNAGSGLNEVQGTANTPLTVNSDGTWTLPLVAGDGKHTFVLRSTDWAEKTKEVTVKVQKDTNPPNLAIMNPSEGQYIPSLITITGTVSDPGAGVADVQVSFDNGLNWKTSADGLTFNESNWSYTPIAADIGAEGSKVLHVWAIDKAGQEVYAKTDIASLTPAQEAQYMRNFSYDSLPPTLTITTPASIETYTNSASYDFTFNAADTQSIDSLTYTLNGGSAVTIFNTATVLPGGLENASGSRTNLTVSSYEIGGLTDGISNEIVFTLTDKANKTASKTVRIIRDTVPPVITITSVIPAIENGSTFDVNGIITVKGSFTDNDRINTATIDDNAAITSKTVTTSGFTVSIDTRTVTEQDGEADITLADVFAFNVQDKSGNTALTTNASTIMTELRTYIIDQATDTPVIDAGAASFDITAAASTDVTSSVNLFTNSQYLTALLSDDDGISRIDFYVDTNGDDIVDGGAIHSITSVNRSVYNMNLRVGDLGLAVDQTHRIQLRITDTKLGTTDATEAGDNGRYASPWFYIGIDTGAPSITIDNSVGGTVKTDGDGEYVDLGFLTADKEVSGTSKGSFSISSVILDSLTKTGAGTGVTDGADVGDEVWSFILEPADSVQEIFTVTATDSFGRNVIKRFSYIFDLDAPAQPAITIPTNNYFKKTAGISLEGTAQETGAVLTQSGLASVEYALAEGEDALIPTTSWSKAAGTSSWEADINLGAGSDDGWWTVFVRATDKSGNESDISTYNIYADSLAPVIKDENGNGSAEASIISKSAAFTPWGTVTEASLDEGGVLSPFTYTRSYKALLTDGWTVQETDSVSLSLTNEWEAPEVDASVSGYYKFDISATDRAGNTSAISRTYMIDTEAPVPSFGNLNESAPYTSISLDDYTFRGSVTDAPSTDGVETLYYKFSKSSTAPADLAGYESISCSDIWSISRTLVEGTDVGSLAADELCEGDWYLYVRAEDKAGNVSTVYERQFTIDKSNPLLDETAVGDALENRTALFDLTISAEDTNGIQSISIIQKKNSTGALTIPSTFVSGDSYDHTISGLPLTSVGPAVSAAVDGSGTDDGLYTYDITVTDLAGKAVTITRTVRFDTKGPDITLAVPVENAYYDSSFTISGVVSDANGLTSTTYNIGSGDTAFTNAASLNASITGLTEGIKTISITSTDAAGNPSILSRTFYVDTADPVLSVNGNAARFISNGETSFIITGSLTDTFKDRVEISFNGTLVDTVTAFTGNAWTSSNLFSSVAENQTITIKIKAYDKAGKSDEEIITVFRDTQDPVVEVNSVTTQLTYPPIVETYTNAVNGIITVKGKVTDNNAISTVTCVLSNGADTLTQNVTLSGSNFSLDIDTTGLLFGGTLSDDYDMTITITAEDAANNVGTSTSTTVHVIQASDNPLVTYSNLTTDGAAGDNLFGTLSNNKILGTFTDDDGLKNVDIVIDGVQTVFLDAAALNNTTSRSFTRNIGGLAEGAHTIAFVLTDKNGRSVTTSAENFAVDAADPVIAVTTQQNSFLPASTLVTVYGNASDGNGFTSINDMTTSTPVVLTTGNLTDKGSLIEWSYEFSTPGATGSGTRNFRATDAFGKTSEVVFNYRVDAAPPSLTVTSTPVSDYINLPDSYTYRVTGNASDSGTGDSGLNDVRYIVKAGDVTAPDAADPDWISAAGLDSWTANVDMSGKPSGVYSLYIMARDVAGNSAVTAKKLIYADLQAPSLTDIVVSTSTVFNTDFIITGNASDPDGYLQKVTAHYTGLAPTPLTLTGAAWSYTVPVTTPLAEGNYTLTITAFDQSGKTSTYTKSFTVDRTAPAISYSNINGAGTTSLTETSPKVYGSLSDANGMTTATVLFRKYNGSIYEAPAGHTAVTVTGFTANSKSLNFTLDMSTILGALLTDGVWQAEIVSTDLTANTRTVTSADFRVDRNNPEVAVSVVRITDGDPINNGYVSAGNSYTVSGTMSDIGGISTVAVQLKQNNTIIQIDGLNSKNAVLNTGDGTWTVDIGDIFATSGTYELIAIATDLAGRVKEDKVILKSDNTAPVITFISPFPLGVTQPAALIGEITISGKSADDAMSSTQYAVGGTRTGDAVTEFVSGDPINWTAFSGVYDWSQTVNTNTKATTEFAELLGGTVWRLPVHVKAVDVSGNVSYETLFIEIDTDLDKPTVEFTSPANNATVGGQFMANGSAVDLQNGSVFRVYMQVEVVGAVYNGSNVLTNFSGSPVTDGYDAAGNSVTHYFTKIGDDDTAWYLINGTGAWNFTLNKLKELNKEELEDDLVSFTPEETTRENSATTTKLIVRVKAVDTNGLFGYHKEIALTLQSGAPSILETDMPEPNKYISGSVNTNFEVTDDEGIDSVSITIAGATTTINYTQVSAVSATVGSFQVIGSDHNTVSTDYYKKWTITRAWDTTAIAAPSAAIAIEATDYSSTSPKTSINNRTVYIDNSAPTFNLLAEGSILGGEVARSVLTNPIAMLGSAATLNGDVTDLGSGLDKVILYFTQPDGANTRFFTMGGITPAGGADTTGEIIAHTITINGTPRPFPVASIEDILLGKTLNIPQKYIVIDKQEGGDDAGDVGDHDGYNEHLSVSGTWYVKPDSYNLNDGFYDVHCVVVDKAGNMSYTTDEMLVQNNKPTITSIDLYTDLDMNDVIDTSGVNVLSTSSGTTGFIVRNDQFSIKVNATAVNGAISYDLALPTGSAASEAGGVYTFTGFGTDGAKTFTLKVADSLGLESAEFTFTVTYENTDATPPEIEFFELNTLIASGANINTGSISPDGGHIETRETSVYSNTLVADPDVSGKIILRGTASDNQRLTSVSLTLGSETFTILTWNGTAMAPATGASVVSQSLEVGGHEVEWAYVWDTSTIRDAEQRRYALENAVVSAAAQDAAGQDSTTNTYDGLITSYNDMTVDVMPYITKVTTNLSKLKKNNPSVYNRTVLGKYPVSSAEAITIEGYNLTTAVVKDDTTPTPGDVAITITNGVVTIPATSVANLASGELAMTVNGIPLLNNRNDNTVETNKRPNGDNNLLLTDDVALDIWQFNSSAAYSVGGAIKELIMKINPNNRTAGFAFANGVDTFSMANGTTNSYTRWQQNYADYGEVAFGFDFQGRSHGIVIGHDTEPNSGYTGRMNYITSRWGVPLTDARDNFRYYSKLRMESCGLPVGSQLNGTNVATRIIDTTRFQSPSLAVASSAARTDPTLYLAYYDNLQEQIRFRWGTNNDATRNVADTGFNQFYDVDTASNRNSTGGSAYDQHIIFEPDASRYSLVAGDENNATGNTGNVAGQYVAIDVIPGANANEDIVAIIWYDGANLMYMYRYGNKDDTNASSAGVANRWSAPILIFEDAGIDCAISVDDTVAHGVHIAAYDRNEGGLRYAYLPSYNAGQDDVETCLVDDYNIVGNKISITTVLDASDNAVPYISYYMPSSQKPKLAYLVDPSGEKAPDGVDDNTAFTGAWEITMIPTASTVNEDRINVDLWRDANNRAGFSTTNGVEGGPVGTSTSTTTTGTVYGNGTKNPLVAYAISVGTNGRVETAQKK